MISEIQLSPGDSSGVVLANQLTCFTGTIVITLHSVVFPDFFTGYIVFLHISKITIPLSRAPKHATCGKRYRYEASCCVVSANKRSLSRLLICHLFLGNVHFRSRRDLPQSHRQAQTPSKLAGS